MSTAKRQHYVPRCLLKHFCADCQTINVTDLIEKKSYKANIMKVAQEKYFYDLDTNKGKISLENNYAELESKAAPIIDKIVETESLAWFDDNDFMVLEDFILCQFYRTRKYVNQVKAFLQSNNVPLFELVDSDGNIKKTLYCNDVGIDDNVAKVMSYNFLYHVEHDDVVRDAIASMEWLLLKATGKQKFIISDDPTRLNNYMANIEQRQDSTGFDLPHSQIFLPISPKLMLCLNATEMAEEARTKLLKILMRGIPAIIGDAFRCSVTGEACPCPDEQVKQFNEAQMHGAERFVYGLA